MVHSRTLTPPAANGPFVPLPSAPPATSASPPPAPPKPTLTTAPYGYNASPIQARIIAQQLVPVSQFACFDEIITHESGWNLHATNASSGAYGLPQALPGYKMGTIAPDWRNNAVTQIKWAISYMDGRYGSPCDAWSFWQAHSWY